MTLIELCVVMGIVTVLMAMVVGLSRYVNEVVKIHQAQAELGEWHEVFSRWYVQFGEYPLGNPGSDNVLQASDPDKNLLRILDDCYFTVGQSNLYFRTFTQGYASPTNDPWGSPYIYDCDPGRKSYILFSCGRDSRSRLNGTPIPSGTTSALDPTLDDVYFER